MNWQLLSIVERSLIAWCTTWPFSYHKAGAGNLFLNKVVNFRSNDNPQGKEGVEVENGVNGLQDIHRSKIPILPFKPCNELGKKPPSGCFPASYLLESRLTSDVS